MKNKPKTIVITGAESTGKSALSKWLSKYYNAPVIPEFARDYIENLGRHYEYKDVEIIARMQIEQFELYKKQGYSIIFADTWLIITKIWFEEVYKHVPMWLEPAIRNEKIDLFLVCDTDLPWIPDKVRENGGEKRDFLQSRYIETIKNYGFKFEIVNGIHNARYEKALHCLEISGIVKPNHT